MLLTIPFILLDKLRKRFTHKLSQGHTGRRTRDSPRDTRRDSETTSEIEHMASENTGFYIYIYALAIIVSILTIVFLSEVLFPIKPAQRVLMRRAFTPGIESIRTKLVTPVYDPGGPDRDCSDFDTQHEASIFYRAAGGPSRDPHKLDSDNNGIPCESLPQPPVTRIPINPR